MKIENRFLEIFTTDTERVLVNVSEIAYIYEVDLKIVVGTPYIMAMKDGHSFQISDVEYGKIKVFLKMEKLKESAREAGK